MRRILKFIDLFAGCGGISLGLTSAGLVGKFAVEKNSMAFNTLAANLVYQGGNKFHWPTWLPQTAMTCEELLANFSDQLIKLRGEIDLMVGGPPCQGFSLAGRRDPVDPRNKMSEQYLAVVGLVQPQFIVIENVAGFNMKFDRKGEILSGTYAEYITERLATIGYRVSSGLLNCADFGIPQNRKRFIIICERKNENILNRDLFKMFQNTRVSFLASKGLSLNKKVTVEDAISDLETEGKIIIDCNDSPISGYKQIQYYVPTKMSAYQELMRGNCNDEAPNSLRLAKHKDATVEKFSLIQKTCRAGVSISEKEMVLVGTKKHSITVLHRKRPAPTITTLPDDILHYTEPRILTVRENARLQSFPDWYRFEGKYTTGGTKRKSECPRYTQVGNAVPPLLAEAIGKFISDLYNQDSYTNSSSEGICSA